MEIRELHLSAIAQFEEVNLDLGVGLHVLYGPNETGKSTLLALLIDLLFGGTPTRRDWYGSASRLAAQLFHEDMIYSLCRRRYRAGLVQIDAEDKPITEEWTSLLGMERDRYMQLYGFDHARLRSGGQSLLANEGDVGISLFEAGSGISFVKQLMEGYRSRLHELFHEGMRSNSTASLNRALRRYQGARSTLRNGQLRPAAWLAKQAAVEQAEADVRRRQDGLNEAERELMRLERIRRNLPMYQERLQVLDQISQLQSIPDISESEEQALADAIAKQRHLANQMQTEVASLRGQEEELSRITVDRPILQYDAALVGLRDDFNVYRQTRDEMGRLEEKLVSRKQAIASQRAELFPALVWQKDEAPARIPYAQNQHLGELYQTFLTVTKELDLAKAGLGKAQEEWNVRTAALAELATVPDISPLLEQIRVWRNQGVSSAKLGKLSRNCALCQQEADNLYEQQRLWQGTLSEILRLPLPLSETIQMYVQDHRKLADEWDRNKRDIVALLDERDRLETQVQALEAAGNVPSEEQLLDERARRDERWQLVRLALHDAAAVTLEAGAYAAGTDSLETAYEAAVKRADGTADRLRREAQSVARKAELLAQIERNEAVAARLREEEAASAANMEKMNAAWRAEWTAAGIVPRTPVEMQAWMQQYLQPLQRVTAELEAADQEANEMRSAVEGASTQIDAWASLYGIKIPDSLTKFDDKLSYAESALQALNRAQTKREAMEQAVAELKRDCDKLATETAKHEASLTDVLQAYAQVRLSFSFLPERISGLPAYLDALNHLCDAMDTYQEEAQVLSQKRTAVDAFEERVRRLLGLLGDANVVSSEDVIAAYHSLQNRLQAAREAQDTFLRQETVVQAERTRLAATKEALARVQAVQQAWMDRLAQSDVAGLLQVVEQSRARRGYNARLQQLEAAMVAAGDGHTLAELLRESAALQDIDAIPSRIEQFQRQIQQEKDELGAYQVKLGEEKQAFAQLDGSSIVAAEAVQEAANASEEVQAYWEEVIRMQTNLTLLEETLAVYRDRNQQGLLESASELFQRLTLHRYQGLELDDHPTAPRLLAVHQDGSKRDFAELSDGTVDGLHFALRLASLKAQSASGTKLPLIMDDVLIHFDDERAAAALEILDEFAEDTQILYFTHHRHLLEQVLPTKVLARLQTHELAQQIRYRQGS